MNAPSINTFKNRLDKYWKNQDILYDYKATLDTSTIRKGSELSIGTHQEVEATSQVPSIQATSHMNGQDVKNQDDGGTQIRGSATSRSADLLVIPVQSTDLTHHENTIIKSPA